MSSSFIDLTGQRFGRLVVLHRMLPPKTVRRVYWLCKCDCGNVVTVLSFSLKSGETKSCRCLQREIVAARATTHGAVKGGKKTPEYRTWDNMKRRCLNPSNKDFYLYGKRGITICDRWVHSFQNFLTDMGPKPGSSYSIDRHDNAGPYNPENCRWVTWKVQNRNTRVNHNITFSGETHPLVEWAEIIGLKRMTLTSRIGKLGWDIGKALTTPLLIKRDTAHLRRRLKVGI